MLDGAGLARALSNRMQQTNANPIALKSRTCFPIETVAHRPIGLAGYRALPEVINGRLLAMNIKLQMERIFCDLLLEIVQARRNGCPIIIPHGGVDSTGNLVVSNPNVAKQTGSRLELHRQRPGPERDWLRKRFVPAVIKNGLWQHQDDFGEGPVSVKTVSLIPRRFAHCHTFEKSFRL